MLKSLTVHNFALIESAVIEFTDGLNIITGETGAGKSIIIDALACVLGERASVESIRSGQVFFRIEAIFDISNDLEALAYLDELAIPVEDAENIIITRRLSITGKNAVLINGCQTTVQTLKRFARNLIDIHGQHESQTLLRADTYIEQLDNFSPEILMNLQQYRTLYRDWKTAAARLQDIENKSQERERRLDILTWQTEEIAAAHLKAGEENELEQQIKLLANSEKIANSIHSAYSGLGGDAGESAGIISRLADVRRNIEQASRFDTRLEQYAGVLTDILYQIQEVERELGNYFQEMEFNPARLSELQARMDTIYKLTKKYGETTSKVLGFYTQAVAEIAELQNIDTNMNTARLQCVELEEKLSKSAKFLDELRKKAANEVECRIGMHLKDLGMNGARFIIAVDLRDSFNEQGSNQVSFLFSANPGEEPKSLNKVASGGELSRIALALKAVGSDKSEYHTMVFDELDAGIGGRTAQMVAEKIAFVSLRHQILCITHLPQIAVMGDNHLYIEKITDGETTKTIVYKLDENARVMEISRMISGDDQSKATLENAINMIRDRKLKKENWKYKAQA